MSKGKICAQCKNYLGGGDWGLSCSMMYGLTSECSSAADCENFDQMEICRNASSILGGFRCSLCGGYRYFVDTKGEKVSIEESVRLSVEAADRVNELTHCPCCGHIIDA